ncbi:uncharacterized protein upd3 [Drosophila tropicalis]|uniref:uncharacterized protein upd3 n=1 Tax=Drosophila tropicalis TaxID=46794 RepID=UPI0035AC16C5
MHQMQQLASREDGQPYGVAATPIPSTANREHNTNTNANTDTLEPTIDPVLSGTSNNTLRLKRYSDKSLKEKFRLALNTTFLDWSQACGTPRSSVNKLNKLKIREKIKTFKLHRKRQWLLKLMQNHTRFVYRDLHDDDLRRNISNVSTDKANDDLKAFDYREMDSPAYDLFRSQYQNFLPSLRAKKDKKLQLRNIHRSLEFYVAAFSYLRHAQLLADMESSNYESVISADLERLRLSARSMLCNVDTTIMEINRLAVTAKHQKNNIIQKIPLKTMPKLTMERRLGNFKTDIVALHKLAMSVAKHGASIPPQMLETTQLPLDVRFVKYEYIEYLNDLLQLLNRQRKKWKLQKVPSSTIRS